MKFEVGKWYKYGKNWALKCSKNSVDKIYYKAYINLISGKCYTDLSSYDNDNVTDIEIPLSEIQQYLPEGHEDLEFVLPEKWHIAVNTINHKTLTEWRSFGVCGTNGYLLSADPFGESRGYWVVEEPKNSTKITFEQFKKYVLKEVVNEFKKDDYIVQLHETKSTHLIKDHVYLQSCNSKNLYTKNDSKGSTCSSSYVNFLNQSDWRYATKEEIAEYDRLGKPFNINDLKKELNVDDLVEGEIYAYDYKNNTVGIFTCRDNQKFSYKNKISTYKTGKRKYEKDGRISNDTMKENLRKPSTEESEWLKTCIKANKFIEKKELVNYDEEGCLIAKKFELKVGKWYCLNDPDNHWLGYIDKLNHYYGFRASDPKAWIESDIRVIDYSAYKIADDEVVKQRLLDYAKEKYPIGTEFNSAFCPNRKFTIDSTDFHINAKFTEIHRDRWNGASVFHKGKWAEIIEEKAVEDGFPTRNHSVNIKSTQNQLGYIRKAYDVPNDWSQVWDVSCLEGVFKEPEKYLAPEVPIKKTTKDKRVKRSIIEVETVENRFKKSPIQKRKLPKVY